jgi:hypothetical protein
MSTSESTWRGSAPVLPDRAAEDTQPLEPPPAGPPGGIPAAPGHRRCRWLWPLVAASAVLIVLVPLLVYAMVEGGQETAPTPNPPASERAPTGPPTPAVPDGRIPIDELWNATLDIPAWPIDALAIGPSGPVRFTSGTSAPLPNSGNRLSLPEDVAYGDVDGDGAQETVVNVHSYRDEGGSWQVVAFDRDRDGAIITLGQVTATTGPVEMIRDHVRVVDGSVQVEVGDYLPRRGDDPAITQWQTRFYGWRSGRFGQVAGPTEFPANPRLTDLALSVEDLVLAAPVDGVRHGTLRVRVTVDRPSVPHRVRLHFGLPTALEREGSAWAGSQVVGSTEDTVSVRVEVAPPASIGASRTYTFGVTLAAGATLGEDPSLTLAVSGVTAHGRQLIEYEPGRDDHYVAVPITVE